MQTARVWRERNTRYRNEVGRCDGCGAMHYPPRLVCDACGSREMSPVAMAEEGRVLTYTVIRTAPPGFANEVPYAVAVIEMDDGTRLMAQVSDIAVGDLKTGLRVRLEFRKIRQDGRAGVICYGHKAVPV